MQKKYPNSQSGQTESDKPIILLVDDNSINLQTIYQSLEDEDYKLLVARSGGEALNIVRKVCPDLILLDILMPGIDGYEVCRSLKENTATSEIPVIFVTTLGDDQFEVEGFEAGGVDYITKPIKPFVLKARVSTHLDLKRKSDFLKEISRLDGLTGIPNRRSFDEFLAREWKRSIRAKSDISLILVDIDHFKAYNDNYGHTNGDNCLKKIAHTLKSVILRATDQIARYGGEEFACVLPETNLSGAIFIGNKLKESVSNTKISHKYSAVADHVTISLGVASMVPGIDDFYEDLINAADAKLYQAKEGGRNRLEG